MGARFKKRRHGNPGLIVTTCDCDSYFFRFLSHLIGVMFDTDYRGEIDWSPFPGAVPAAAESVPGNLFRTFHMGRVGWS